MKRIGWAGAAGDWLHEPRVPAELVAQREEKMRVLQFGRFWNEDHGGIERHVALLSTALAAQGVDVVNLVSAIAHQPPSDERMPEGYRLVQVRSHGVLASTAVAPGLPFKAMALHRQQPFDIFHLHLPDPLSHLTSLMLPRRVPRVITWHSDVVRQQRLQRLYQPFVGAELRRAAAIVGGTGAHFSNSTQIPLEVPASRKHVIPYGLDYAPLTLNAETERLRQDLRARAAGRPVLFALGRHVYYKGFDVLIEAMREIDALLYLGGSGPLSNVHRAQVEAAGLGERVHLCGRIPEAQLPAYFHACDLYCLPSVEQSEAFGLVQLEAMACGKPVVSSQLHNGVNVVNLDGVTGVAVPPRDPQALSQAIRALLADPERRERLGRQARERAHAVYSMKGMADTTLELYRSLTRAGPD